MRRRRRPGERTIRRPVGRNAVQFVIRTGADAASRRRANGCRFVPSVLTVHSDQNGRGKLKRLRIVSAAAVISASLAASSANADVDRFNYPTIIPHSATLDGFVPKGWRIESQAQGVLEPSHQPAVAFLLHKGSGDDESDPRLLAVALEKPNGSFDLILQNHTFIPRLTHPAANDPGPDYSGDPKVEIKRGALRIYLSENWSMGSNSDMDHVFTFRFDGRRFLLIGYQYFAVTQSLDTGKVSINYLTHKLSRSRGADCAGREDVVKHCRWNTTWKAWPARPLLSIEDIGNGLDFDPGDVW